MAQPRGWLSPQADRTGLSAAAKSVLVVDDDRGVRRLTARMLRLEGYKVIEAASGEEALSLLDTDPDVDVMVTDIVMPAMHGLELADLALARIPKLRVVLMTGHAPELTAQLEVRNAKFPLLLKPFSAQQLLARVREVLAQG
jgi:two-component system, cell cycle sensor histidine kinase and response regulator CckA